ncbi:MAG: ATP-binding cassette domain-containing protein [Alteromonadaceae bacterium]|nr:ATP-binding cassette domain-containing protein [Alteromonadaceae bacterium]
MTQTTAHHDQAQQWLKDTAQQARASQMVVLSVRLVQLVAQISAFWFLASIMQLIVVTQHAALFSHLLPLIVSLTAWGLCVYLADFLSANAKQTIEGNLENSIHTILNAQQIAITRRFSATFWQQLLLVNVSDLGDYFVQYSVQKYLSVLAPIVVLLVIFPINYLVALCLLLTLPIVPLFMILVGNGAANLHRKHFVALERLGDLFSDRLKALPMITANGQHQQQAERLNTASNIVNKRTMKVVSVAFLSSSVLDFFATVSIALIAVFIGFTMLGELNIGPEINLHKGLFMLLVAPLLFSELRTLGKFYHQKAKADAGADRFSQVLAECKATSQRQDAQEDNKDNGFSGIAWLNYKVHTPCLHASKLVVQKNDWILLTGSSGSGKTVLLEALIGFRQASHSLNADTALLSQQSCILAESLAFNLHLGSSAYSASQLEQCLSEVGLNEWLSGLPDGLNTQMGDLPALSGGEAQRLALARVLLLQKEIILLDEPTAHLSEVQRQQIASLIHEKLADKTVIWVSHHALPEEWFSQHWTITDSEIQVLS